MKINSIIIIVVLGLISSCISFSNAETECTGTIVREDSLGVPILTSEGDNGSSCDGIIRAVHGGWYMVYRTPRDTLETPIAMRTQMMYWKMHASVIAATKLFPEETSANMLDPLIQNDGTYQVPTYKLPSKQLEELYATPLELMHFRAKTLVCSLNQWYEISLKSYMTDYRVPMMKEYLDQLALPPSNRTNEAALSVGRFDPNFQVDCSTPCEEDYKPSHVRPKAKNKNAPFDVQYVTPQCVAEGIGKRINDFRGRDGWNELGTDRGMGAIGRADPFKDPTGYYSAHIAPNINGDRTNWASIVECNQGACVSPDFITPHIGLTSRTYFLNQTDRYQIVSNVTKPPMINYTYEMDKILDEMKNVSDSGFIKTKIATYDNKFLYADGFGQLLKNLTWEMISYWANDFLFVEYEGTVINWHAKVNNNHVRPMTVAQEQLGDKEITNWVYGREGVAQYPAKEWQSYIRTMPHAEFPSGSACLCAAASAITARLFDKGYDDYFPLEIEFNANSVEPRLSGQGYKQTYNNPKEYADDCSFTRFQGGMHYDFSLEPGSWMCTEANDFISKAEAYGKYLWTGNKVFLEPYGGIKAFGYEGDRTFTYT